MVNNLKNGVVGRFDSPASGASDNCNLVAPAERSGGGGALDVL